jgi:hypothetical protein
VRGDVDTKLAEFDFNYSNIPDEEFNILLEKLSKFYIDKYKIHMITKH